MLKKFLNKIKKIFSAIGIFLFSASTKVLAIIQPEYGIRNSEPDLYGPPRTETSSIPAFWKITRNFIVPIAFLIGVIIYFKKSKSSTKKKILVTIGIIVIIAILYFVVNKIIYELA